MDRKHFISLFGSSVLSTKIGFRSPVEKAFNLSNGSEVFHSHLKCLEPITGGFKRDEVWWVAGELPAVEELTWLAIDIAAELAFSGQANVGIFCFVDDIGQLREETKLLRSNIRHPDAKEGQVHFFDLRGCEVGQAIDRVGSEIKRNNLDVIVIESIRLTKGNKDGAEPALLSTLENLASETNCCVFAIPWGATFAYLDFDVPKLSENAGREYHAAASLFNDVMRYISLSAKWYSAPFYGIEGLVFDVSNQKMLVSTISTGEVEVEIKIKGKLAVIPMNLVNIHLKGELQPDSTDKRMVTSFYCHPKTLPLPTG